jgi:hypothetical protein
MTRSNKSNSAFIFDLPAVEDISGIFRYNFFTKDESIDDLDDVAKTPSFWARPKPKNRPRYNLIVFQEPNLSSLDSEILGSAHPSSLAAISTIFNLTGGEHELDPASLVKAAKNDLQLIPTSKFSDITFQDTNVGSKLFTLVQKAVNRMVIAENEKVQSEIDQERFDFLSRRLGSQNDYARILGREFENVNEDFLLASLNQTQMLNEAFIDESEKKDLTKSIFDKVKSLTLNARVNDKIVGSAVRTVINEGVSLYSEELVANESAASQIEDRAGSTANFFPDAAYFTISDMYGLPPHAEQDQSKISLDIVGYVIDKFQDLGNGNVVEKEPVFVSSTFHRWPSSNIMLGYDFDIAYGTTYSYSVRAIYLMSMPVKNDDQVSSSYFFVSSKPSNIVHLQTHEIVPPEPPADFIVTFDYQKQKPLLMWSFPFNKQNDVKRFQVLRRRTVDDPFELIHEIDFDDSIVKYDTPEFISPHLKRKMKNPITFFIDEKFERDQSFIYTLRSIDAHGQMSGYGEQIHARYDRFTNRLVTSLISIRGTRTGCPVQYPNFYIDKKVLHETAKDSNHSRVKLYLDPEYLKVLTSDPDDPQRTQDLHFLPFSGDNEDDLTSRFKLQILNTDLQQSKIVDIFIKDRRASEDN